MSTRSAEYMEAIKHLPGLTSELLTEFLDLSKMHGQSKALAAFRRRIRARKPKSRKV